MAGPALGGGLFGLAGSDATMFVIALLYAVACAALLPLARLRTARTGHRGLLREAAAGVRYVFRQPALRGMAVGYSLNQACWGMLSIAVPVFIVRELGAGARAEVLDEEPAWPPERDQPVGRELKEICMKCLVHVPSRRFRSAGALGEAVELGAVGGGEGGHGLNIA